MYSINPEEYDTDGITEELVSLIGPATPIEEMAGADLVAAETCKSKEEIIRMALSFGIDIEKYHTYIR